jgi:hypothetical protein
MLPLEWPPACRWLPPVSCRRHLLPLPSAARWKPPFRVQPPAWPAAAAAGLTLCADCHLVVPLQLTLLLVLHLRLQQDRCALPAAALLALQARLPAAKTRIVSAGSNHSVAPAGLWGLFCISLPTRHLPADNRWMTCSTLSGCVLKIRAQRLSSETSASTHVQQCHVQPHCISFREAKSDMHSAKRPTVKTTCKAEGEGRSQWLAAGAAGV